MTLDDEDRLTSWKTIAAYLQCNERTVKRWEKERALPIRRLPGTKRGGVYAYRSELDAWLRAEKERLPSGKIAADEPTADDGRRSRRWLGWGVAAAALVIVLSTTFFFSGKNRLTHGHHRPTEGTEELYLRGRYLWNLRTAESLAKAADAFTQAIVEDPLYAEAYAGLAEIYDLLPQFGGADLGESFTKAIIAADRAIQLNPDLADAHRAKAFAAFFWNWDILGSDSEFRMSLALDPNSAQTHHW
jgi:tetratricopeptide (TPR) repeat protein